MVKYTYRYIIVEIRNQQLALITSTVFTSEKTKVFLTTKPTCTNCVYFLVLNNNKYWGHILIDNMQIYRISRIRLISNANITWQIFFVFRNV